MEITKTAVGMQFDQDKHDIIDKKLERVEYARDLIEDMHVIVKYDKHYIFECNIHFHWGTKAHISAEDFDFEPALNKMIDILDQKIKKEKDKNQSHGHK
ncbi:MAG: HPF/RaiA family ribosome-associated protein [Treponemataceae bacterium]